ncbi:MULTISPECIES: hypothetical protein [Bacillus]|uniref:hypothetical protein n=1 Tax=Bacillus TaxID=1386 RepID=UPI0003027B66|nr:MULTISPECIES: hypothetical protein [Bacillus]
MRHFSYLIIVLFIILTGCNDSSNNKEKNGTLEESSNNNLNELSNKEKQQIITSYINEDIKKVSDYELEAIESLGKVSGENYTDEETFYKELVNKTIPAHEKAVSAAKDLKPKLKELNKANEKMVLAINVFHESLVLEKEAQDKKDDSLREKSVEKMEEYYQVVEEYHQEMKKVSDKYNIEYSPLSTK